MAQAAASHCREQHRQALPREAVRYAIRELARRAGVTVEFFETWRIEFDDRGFTSVFVNPGTGKRLIFPSVSLEFWDNLHAGRVRTSTAGWMSGPAAYGQGSIPDFRIPFSSLDCDVAGPLFSPAHPDGLKCPVDLPISALLTLSRFEETFPVQRDEHGRFQGTSSIAWADKFLHRAIVDEYGLGIQQAISFLLPRWQPVKRPLRVKLGHDVDEIGLPFNFHSTAAHALRRRRPGATVRDLLAPLVGIDTTYLKLLREIVSLSVEHELDSTVYWKYSAKGPHDTGYDPRHPLIRECIKTLHEEGIRTGIHPGYQTFRCPERFSSEVAAMTDLLGTRNVGGRQDFLRWTPNDWVAWESEGLLYDASVGFADSVGFRAGTAYPYRPWLLSENREARLLEIPIIAMDTTLHGYMRLDPDQALETLRDYVVRCRVVGGVFHLIWHNTTMMHPGYSKIYKTLTEELSGSKRYEMEDWP